MNKSILCLLVFLCSLLTLTEAAPVVEANRQATTMNIMTLIYVQSQFFFCLLMNFTALFWDDGGYYFRHCFNNFVAKPVFY